MPAGGVCTFGWGCLQLPVPKKGELTPINSPPLTPPWMWLCYPGCPKQPAVLVPTLVFCWELTGGSTGVLIVPRAAGGGGGGGSEQPGFGAAVLSTEGQLSCGALQPRQYLRDPIKKRKKKQRETSDGV